VERESDSKWQIAVEVVDVEVVEVDPAPVPGPLMDAAVVVVVEVPLSEPDTPSKSTTYLPDSVGQI